MTVRHRDRYPKSPQSAKLGRSIRETGEDRSPTDRPVRLRRLRLLLDALELMSIGLLIGTLVGIAIAELSGRSLAVVLGAGVLGLVAGGVAALLRDKTTPPGSGLVPTAHRSS